MLKLSGMGCNHLEVAGGHIQKIIRDVYPEIQYCFIQIDRYCNSENNLDENQAVKEIWDLTNDLKSVFHALFTYETKLVFPAVLKFFDKAGSKDTTPLPDVAELLTMTKNKEKELLKLCDRIDILLQRADTADFPHKEEIANLVSAFQNEFAPEKEMWGEMLKDKIEQCAGIGKTS